MTPPFRTDPRPMADLGEPTSAELLQGCRRRDGQAAEEVFRRYAGRLVALARSRLSRRLARRVDAEDVALSAWRSFFVGAAEGRFEVSRGGDLWRLLVSITLHKLYRQARRHAAGRRDLAAERSLEALPGELLPVDGRGPTPEEAAALADEVEAVLRPLDAFARRVLELRLQGEPVEGIASAVGRSERTVRRTLAELRAVLSARAERNRDE